MRQILPLYPDIRQVDILYGGQIVVLLHLGDLSPAQLKQGDLGDHVSDALFVLMDLLIMFTELLNQVTSLFSKEGICF